jgi:ribosomal protein S27AE
MSEAKKCPQCGNTMVNETVEWKCPKCGYTQCIEPEYCPPKTKQKRKK